MLSDRIFTKLAETKAVPGLAACIQKKGQIVLYRGYGYANIDQGIKVDAQKTVFRAASASKPIAATALAKMVQDNIIDLDDSFYKYVPYYPKKSYDFNIRQLAAHTAGIRSYKGREYALNKPYSIKDSLEVFQKDALLFEPGTSYNYNSFDWVMISLAMEEASGISFHEYVENEVLKPLAMLNTKMEIPEEKMSNQAEFYTRWSDSFRKATTVDNRYKLAGGGYLTTVGDLVKLGQAYLDNNFLKESISREFLTAQKVKDKSTFYGLGWEVSRDGKGRNFFGHTGNSVGGYSNFYIYPEEEIVIAILINSTDPKVQPMMNEAIDASFTLDKIA